MAEAYDVHKAYKEYLEANEGKPINPIVARAGEEELKEGKRGGYPAYGDEPDRKKYIDSLPKGRLEECETDLSPEELRQGIEDLKAAAKVFKAYFKNKKVPGFETPHTTTLLDIENLGEALPEDLAKALQIIQKYLDTEGEDVLNEVPSLIEQEIALYERALARHKKDKGQGRITEAVISKALEAEAEDAAAKDKHKDDKPEEIPLNLQLYKKVIQRLSHRYPELSTFNVIIRKKSWDKIQNIPEANKSTLIFVEGGTLNQSLDAGNAVIAAGGGTIKANVKCGLLFRDGAITIAPEAEITESLRKQGK